jgi:hypothetical protein
MKFHHRRDGRTAPGLVVVLTAACLEPLGPAPFRPCAGSAWRLVGVYWPPSFVKAELDRRERELGRRL